MVMMMMILLMVMSRNNNGDDAIYGNKGNEFYAMVILLITMLMRILNNKWKYCDCQLAMKMIAFVMIYKKTAFMVKHIKEIGKGKPRR